MTEALKSRRVRSTAYPAINLSQAIDSVKKLNEAYGEGPYSRENVAKGLGYSNLNGAAAVRVAALSHYGLLDRSNSSYRLSILGKNIIFDVSEESSKKLLVEAAKSPTLFNKLYEEYLNKAIPLKLNNILILNHGINKNVADQVVQNFNETMEFVGLLKNGVIIGNQIDELNSSDGNNEGCWDESVKMVQQQPLSPTKLGDQHYQIFHFDSGIILYIPVISPKISKAILRGELVKISEAIEEFEKTNYNSVDEK